MGRSEDMPISFTRGSRGADATGDCRFTVVWLRGEHDASTKLAVVSVIDRVSELDRCDVLVDLSGVMFMDASIVGAIVGARNRLRLRGLSLSLRAPSTFAQQVLGLCDLADLVGVPAVAVGRPAASCVA